MNLGKTIYINPLNNKINVVLAFSYSEQKT